MRLNLAIGQYTHSSKTKMFGLGITCVLMTAVLTGCNQPASSEPKATAQDTSLEQVRKNGVLRVGAFVDNPPFGYVDSAGKNQGFDVALATPISF